MRRTSGKTKPGTGQEGSNTAAVGRVMRATCALARLLLGSPTHQGDHTWEGVGGGVPCPGPGPGGLDLESIALPARHFGVSREPGYYSTLRSAIAALAGNEASREVSL